MNQQLPDISKITELLPHRYPMLLVDRVIAYDGETLTAIKNVTANEAFFQGHFPHKPIMPGVLILEALGQACGLLMAEHPSLKQQFEHFLFFVVGIENAKFRSTVIPGDQLELEVKVKRMKGVYFSFDTCAKVDGKVATEAVINLMVDNSS